MKISMFVMRTQDIAETKSGEGGEGAIIKMKDSEAPFAVYRVDADFPETSLGRVADKSPYLDQAFAELRRAIVGHLGFSDGTASLDRGRMLRELLEAAQSKTDEELGFMVKLAGKVMTIPGIAPCLAGFELPDLVERVQEELKKGSGSPLVQALRNLTRM